MGVVVSWVGVRLGWGCVLFWQHVLGGSTSCGRCVLCGGTHWVRRVSGWRRISGSSASWTASRYGWGRIWIDSASVLDCILDDALLERRWWHCAPSGRTSWGWRCILRGGSSSVVGSPPSRCMFVCVVSSAAGHLGLWVIRRAGACSCVWCPRRFAFGCGASSVAAHRPFVEHPPRRGITERRAMTVHLGLQSSCGDTVPCG